MKRFIYGVLISFILFVTLLSFSSCGSASTVKLGMTKEKVLDSFEEKPLYEKNNNLYWYEDSFIDIYSKYDINLKESDDAYSLIKTNYKKNASLRSSIDNLSYKLRIAKFDNENKLNELYYDIDHKFSFKNNEVDDYSAMNMKNVTELDFSKSRIEFYVSYKEQFKNNKNKSVYAAIIVDFENITYEVEFDDGSLLKGYFKDLYDNDLSGEINEKSKHFETFIDLVYVNGNEFDYNTLKTTDILKKVSCTLKTDFIRDYDFIFSKAKCVGFIDMNNQVLLWDTNIEYLPDYVDRDSIIGEMTETVENNVIYNGYSLNPYYEVVGIKDKTKSTYSFNSRTQIIKSDALSNLINCYKLTLPSNLKTIEANAITNNINLMYIYIPLSVESIGENNFTGSPRLLEIVNESKVFNENLAYQVLNNNAGYFTSLDDYKKEGCEIYVDSYYNRYVFAKFNDRFSEIEGWFLVAYIGKQEDVKLPDTVTVNGKKVSEYNIYRYAFIGNSTIKSITIPTSVKYIDTRAFDSCFALTEVNSESNLQIASNAFQNCNNLTTINLQNVTTINSYAFRNCEKLTDVNLDSANWIDSGAFENCKSLVNISLPSMSYLNPSLFNNCTNLVSVSAPITGVYSNVFNNCKKLTTLDGFNLNYIESQAFKNCTSLTRVNLDDSSLIIHDDAFDGCTSLIFNSDSSFKYLPAGTNDKAYLYDVVTTDIADVVLLDTILCIRVSAFDNAGTINSLTVPQNISFDQLQGILDRVTITNYNSYNGSNYIGSNQNSYLALVKNLDSSVIINSNVKYIMSNAFKDSQIESIVIPENVEFIGNNAFRNCDNLESININKYINFYDNVFSDCDNLTQVNISYNMGSYMFSDCKKLEKVVLNDINYIQSGAFKNCISIVELDLSLICDINDEAFMGCTNLNTVTGNNITNIYNRAFYNCNKLDTINLKKANYIESYAFYNTKIETINLEEIVGIGDYAFANCYELQDVKLGSKLEYINSYVFDNCSKLTSLNIPNSCNMLGTNICNLCNMLEYVTIPTMVFEYIENAFGNSLDTTDIYYCGTVEELERYGFKLYYLELNQHIYIYSEDEPIGMTKYQYWHYDSNNEPVIW